MEILKLLVFQNFHCFAKALEVNDFALAKEFDDVSDVGVVAQTKNVVVHGSRLLLGCQVLVN